MGWYLLSKVSGVASFFEPLTHLFPGCLSGHVLHGESVFITCVGVCNVRMYEPKARGLISGMAMREIVSIVEY